jgi:hypothetical protein
MKSSVSPPSVKRARSPNTSVQTKKGVGLLAEQEAFVACAGSPSWTNGFDRPERGVPDFWAAAALASVQDRRAHRDHGRQRKQCRRRFP